VTGGMVIVTDDSGLVRAFVEPRLQAYFPAPSTSPGATAAPSSAPSLPALLSLTATFDQATSGIEVPADVAVGPDGHLYVVNTKTSEVLVLDSDTGAIVRRWGGLGSGQGQFNFNIDPSDEFNAAGGIAVADDGTVYVADTANRRVEVFDAAGNFVSQWGRFGTDDGQFLFPEDIAIGPDGDVYVLDGSRSDIQRFTSDGTFASVVGGYGTGPGQLSSMGGIAVGPDGTIYDADFDPNRVQAWNADGSFAWMMAGDGSISDLFWPADVAVGDNGLLYVSEGPGDPPLRRVTTYDRDRNRIGSWVAPGPTDSLAYRDGSLYVSCFFTSQILKAAPTQ
jgi:DNA-binding beta-propeller fold protein YncE